jgi:hypothetical protein
VWQLHFRLFARCHQGCQMVCFQTKNPNLGKFWRALEWKMLVYFMLIRNIFRSFGICYGHLVMLCQFGIFSLVLVYCMKKSGNPGCHTSISEKEIGQKGTKTIPAIGKKSSSLRGRVFCDCPPVWPDWAKFCNLEKNFPNFLEGVNFDTVL